MQHVASFVASCTKEEEKYLQRVTVQLKEYTLTSQDRKKIEWAGLSVADFYGSYEANNKMYTQLTFTARGSSNTKKIYPFHVIRI